MKYVCELCGRVYDEASGEPGWGAIAGTAFADVSTYVSCPTCGSEKEAFSPVGERRGILPNRKKDEAFWHSVKYGESVQESQR